MNAPGWNGDPPDDGEFDDKPLEADDHHEPPDMAWEPYVGADEFAELMETWRQRQKN